MNLLKKLILTLITFLVIFGTSKIAMATNEKWVNDPTNSIKFCIVVWDENVNIVSASWIGPAVNGVAEGYGKLQYVFKGKDGKETTVQADGEMFAGKLNGKVNIKWSDGDSYIGNYKNGVREGQGIFKFGVGNTYDGEWKAGLQNGYGTSRNSKGEIVHEGEWSNGEPVIKLKTDKVLGISWGATENEAKQIMGERSNTTRIGSDKKSEQSWQIYVSTYNDEPARVEIFFYQGKMYQVTVQIYANEDQILDKFHYVKRGLTGRYGIPYTEVDTKFDSKAAWNLGEGYKLGILVGKHQIPQLPSSWGKSQFPWRFPFAVTIFYGHPQTSYILEKKAEVGSSKDY